MVSESLITVLRLLLEALKAFPVQTALMVVWEWPLEGMYERLKMSTSS